jgi:hypothetical protein
MRKKKLSVAEEFYIREHFPDKTIPELAADLGLKEAVVLAFASSLPPKKSSVQQAGFQEKAHGRAKTVSMTPAASAPQPVSNDGWDKGKLKGCIHKFRPDEPSY